MGIPVVIAENGIGVPIKSVVEGDLNYNRVPLMTVAENGFGMPIVLSDLGTPARVEGGGVPVYPGAMVDLDFVTGRGFQNGFRGPVASFLGGSAYTINESGVLISGAVSLLSNAGVSLAEGTWLSELEFNANSLRGWIYRMRVDGTNNIGVSRETSNRLRYLVGAGTTQADFVSAQAGVNGEVYRTANAYKTNDFRQRFSVAFGADGPDDTSGNVPTGAFTVWIGSSIGTDMLESRIRRLIYLPTAVPNAEMDAWRDNIVINGEGTPLSGSSSYVGDQASVTF